MTHQQIRALFAEIEAVDTFYHPHPDTATPLPMRCLTLPQLSWEPAALEATLGIDLPIDLKYLWDGCSGIVLFQDMTYSQWGLVLWSPDQALVRHQRYITTLYDEPGDVLAGDFIIGEFLGDRELIVIRSDATADDFGTVVIARPLDARQDWPSVAASISEFLSRFLRANLQRFGEKYWER